MKIISGGQTGVDRAALDVALSLGVASGGWCPAGRLDEGGIIPPRYPLQELPGGGYIGTHRAQCQRRGWHRDLSPRLAPGRDKSDRRFLHRKAKAAVTRSTPDRRFPSGCGRTARRVRSDQNGSRSSMSLARAPANGRRLRLRCRVAEKFLPHELRTHRGPKLSFVVPAHNEEHELPETLCAPCAPRRRCRKGNI